MRQLPFRLSQYLALGAVFQCMLTRILADRVNSTILPTPIIKKDRAEAPYDWEPTDVYNTEEACWSIAAPTATLTDCPAYDYMRLYNQSLHAYQELEENYAAMVMVAYLVPAGATTATTWALCHFLYIHRERDGNFPCQLLGVVVMGSMTAAFTYNNTLPQENHRKYGSIAEGLRRKLNLVPRLSPEERRDDFATGQLEALFRSRGLEFRDVVYSESLKASRDDKTAAFHNKKFKIRGISSGNDTVSDIEIALTRSVGGSGTARVSVHSPQLQRRGKQYAPGFKISWTTLRTGLGTSATWQDMAKIQDVAFNIGIDWEQRMGRRGDSLNQQGYGKYFGAAKLGSFGALAFVITPQIEDFDDSWEDPEECVLINPSWLDINLDPSAVTVPCS